MILQSVKTELAAAPSSTPANAAQKSSGPGEANSRTRLNPRRLNLHIKRLNVEGLAPSEQGIFIAAFQARIDTLTQAAAQGEPWSHFVSGPRTSTIRRIDGGVLTREGWVSARQAPSFVNCSEELRSEGQPSQPGSKQNHSPDESWRKG
jgi:hypothetical protein